MQPVEDNFDLKLERCDHGEYKSKCDCCVKFELDTKFKLPLRNLEMIIDGNGCNMLDHGSGEENNNCIRLKMKNHKYHVVNSCNGLRCLSSPCNNYPLVVCNHVTGELINLPRARKGSFGATIGCGFGFSPATHKYIVIRTSNQWTQGTKMAWPIYSGIGSEVRTLGTETWKAIDFPTQAIRGSSPTYLNVFLYWPYLTQTFCAISFDIENEWFGFISAPTMKSLQYNEVRDGALGGELSMSCYYTSSATGVWVLKDYGTTKAWSKVFLHSIGL